MLLLLFQIGTERYALDTSHVVEVAPLLILTRVPQAPKGVAGIFNYRGRPVAAIDLAQIFTGRPAEQRLSTRLIIVSYNDSRGKTRLLGLVAEGATEVVRKRSDEFIPSGLEIRNAPYLGPILMDSRGSIQLVYEDRLVPEHIINHVFTDTLGNAAALLEFHPTPAPTPNQA